MRKGNVCQWAGQQVVQLHDGELGAVELDRYWHHLRLCSDCRQDHDRFTSLLGVVKSMPQQAPSVDLCGDVLAQISAPTNYDVRFVPAFALLALMLMGASLGYWFQDVVPVRSRVASLDVVDQSSGMTLDLDTAISLAKSNQRKVLVRPVVDAPDAHRRALLEKALYQQVRNELGAREDAHRFVEVGEPLLRSGSVASSPYVLAVDSLY